MEDDDYPMGEDTIMMSTESNGELPPVTVAPSEIFGDIMSPHIPRIDQLPFHSPSKVPSLLQPDATASYRNAPEDPISPDEWTEPVPVASSAPARRQSPQVRIPPNPRSMVLRYATGRTGLVYDPRMRFHAELSNMNINDIHPEDPRRIHSIFEEIRQAGLVSSSMFEEDTREDHCWRISLRPATKAEIMLIHTEEHYAFVESLQRMTIAQLSDEAAMLDSIYFNHATYECAKLAVGGAIEACKAVVEGAVRNAIAIIRPPGHHAESTQPSGFCIFNNVPIATRVCQNAYPETCRKVLILDWDVHHGNGIQHAFYDDPNVLYISLHVYKNGQFYPSLPDGNLDFCGDAPGEGKNVNIPWEELGMGDAEYLYAFQEVVMPIASEFDPDLVIISAGFDAAEGDLLGGCFVTPACYGHMTHMLMRLAKGKLVVCLEGGYNLRSIARSALAVTRVLMLEPPDRLREDLPPPKESAVRVVEQVKRQHSKHWKSMFPKHLERDGPTINDTHRLHDVIREWQSQRLSEEHFMTPLPLQINRAGLSQTFEHNVIATPQFTKRHPLLVIFHDPPGFHEYADPLTGNQELHNTWLTDVPKRYIDWAINNGFQVIDINIPKIVSVKDAEVGYVPSEESEDRVKQSTELAEYLWENYIEPNDATQVFLMGIGDSYTGLVKFLDSNCNITDEDSQFACLIGFVAGNITSIKRTTDDSIADWFYEHTKVFLKSDHKMWDPNRQRKLRKKFGKLVKSKKDQLDEMLVEHFREVQTLLSEMKSEFEEKAAQSSQTDEDLNSSVGGLRSPPLPSGAHTPKHSSVGLREEQTLRSPKMPALGYFSVSSASPRSPRSPMKRTF